MNETCLDALVSMTPAALTPKFTACIERRFFGYSRVGLGHLPMSRRLAPRRGIPPVSCLLGKALCYLNVAFSLFPLFQFIFNMINIPENPKMPLLKGKTSRTPLRRPVRKRGDFEVFRRAFPSVTIEKWNLYINFSIL